MADRTPRPAPLPRTPGQRFGHALAIVAFLAIVVLVAAIAVGTLALFAKLVWTEVLA